MDRLCIGDYQATVVKSTPLAIQGGWERMRRAVSSYNRNGPGGSPVHQRIAGCPLARLNDSYCLGYCKEYRRCMSRWRVNARISIGIQCILPGSERQGPVQRGKHGDDYFESEVPSITDSTHCALRIVPTPPPSLVLSAVYRVFYFRGHRAAMK